MKALWMPLAACAAMIVGCGGGMSSSCAASDLKGEAMGTGYHLTWTDACSDESEFMVEQKIGTGAFTEVARVPFNTTQYMVENLTAGQEYRFRVSAMKSGSMMGMSNELMHMP